MMAGPARSLLTKTTLPASHWQAGMERRLACKMPNYGVIVKLTLAELCPP